MDAAYLPAGQFTHVVGPVDATCIPEGQFKHLSEVAYLPAGQFTHVVDPVDAAYLPAGQFTHVVDPVDAAYLPAGQGCFRPSWQNIPAGQSSQAEAPISENAPVGQTLSWPNVQ